MAFIKKLFASLKKSFFFSRRTKKSAQKKSKTVGQRKKHKLSSQKIRKKSKIVKIVKPKSVEQAVAVGEITHYFSKIEVCVIKVTKGEIHVGDKIQIKGAATDFSQTITSLQIESVNVNKARKGQLVGLKVSQKVKAGDKVYKVIAHK